MLRGDPRGLPCYEDLTFKFIGLGQIDVNVEKNFYDLFKKGGLISPYQKESHVTRQAQTTQTVFAVRTRSPVS
jgi:hypothetical protein